MAIKWASDNQERQLTLLVPAADLGVQVRYGSDQDRYYSNLIIAGGLFEVTLYEELFQTFTGVGPAAWHGTYGDDVQSPDSGTYLVNLRQRKTREDRVYLYVYSIESQD